MTQNPENLAAAPPMTPEAFALLGGDSIAYVKPVRSEDVRRLFPQAPALAPGMTLFALHGADGTPILLAASRAAVMANASEHDLETVSVH